MHSRYQLQQNAADGSYVLSGPTGIDTITGVSKISFDDGYVSFDPNSNAAFRYRLALVALNRPVIQGGFSTIVWELDTSGTTWKAHADSVATIFSGLTNEQLVNQLFTTVLRVDPATSTDAANFIADLNAGTKSRGDLLLWLANSPTVMAETQAIIDAGLWVENPAAPPSPGLRRCSTLLAR